MRAGAALLLALLIGVAGWVAAHRIPWHPRAPQLWSEADLPALPKDSENGWVIANAAAGWLEKDVVPLGLREPLADPDWTRLRSLAGPIRQLLADPVVREWEALAESAVGAPRFADACAIGVDARCRHAPLARLREVAALGAAGAALDGRWVEGLARAGRLLRADMDLMRTSRSALSALFARRSVKRDLALIGVLLDGIAREAPGSLAGVRAGLQGVASQLEPVAEPDTDCRRAVIAEYLFVTAAVRGLSRAAGSDRGALPLVVLDEEHTLALANRYFERLERFARSPTTAEAPPLRRNARETFGWWLYNPAGKLILDASMIDHAPALREMAAQRAEIEVVRKTLWRRVGALLSPPRAY